MAPTTKPVPSGQKRRARMQKRLHTLQQKENAENKEAITQLQEALKKKDEELASLTAEQMETLDVEMEDDDSGKPESPSASGEDTEENKKEKKKAAKDGKKKNKKSSKEVIFDSIESQDASEDDEDGIFVKESEPEPDSDSDSDFNSDSDSDSDSDSGAYSDVEYGKALYTFAGTKPVKDVKTVGWSGGRFTGYINMYGKKSAARYRLERSAFPAEYEDNRPKNEKVSNPNNRYGDKLSDSGKFKYTKRHIRGIFGVAWKAAGPRVSRHDLDCINPDLVDNWRGVPTYVLIAWDINGDIQKTWETYMEAKTGKRPAKSRSPSVGLAQGHVRKQREKSLGMNRSSPSRSARTTRASKSPQRGTNTLEELRQEFLDNYLELLGVQEFADLDISERRDCVNAWKEEKALQFPA
ncbi:hypothetical protein NW754_009121 [Fusarium falciforme]|nr:hypothetical protein NW754_009121 [Fusarium falciforme]